MIGPAGKIETTRSRERDAEDAARVIGGTKWRFTGYRVEPVRITFDRPQPQEPTA